MSPWLSGIPYYYVRGMAPENVGYFVDGVKIPLLFHVGSGPSTIAPSLVETVDLFPAAYPARYGRFAGAVIAGETSAPNEQRAHGEVQARVFDAAAPSGSRRPSATARRRRSPPRATATRGSFCRSSTPATRSRTGTISFASRTALAGGDRLSLFVFGSYDELKNLGSPTFHVEYHRADVRYDHPLEGGNLRVAATLSYDDTPHCPADPLRARGPKRRWKGPGGRIRAELDRHVSSTTWVRAGADLSVNRLDVDRDDDGAVPGAAHRRGGGRLRGRRLAPAPPARARPRSAVRRLPNARTDDAWPPQPRLSGKVKLTPNVAWISALGIAHQEPTDVVFVLFEAPERDRRGVSSELPALGGDRSSAPSGGCSCGPRASTTLLEATGVLRRTRAKRARASSFLSCGADFTQRLGLGSSPTVSRARKTLWAHGRSGADGDRTAPALRRPGLRPRQGVRARRGSGSSDESGRPYELDVQLLAGPDGEPLHRDGTAPRLLSGGRAAREAVALLGREVARGQRSECFNAPLDKGEATSVSYSPQEGFALNRQNPIILPSVGVEAGF